MIGSSDLVVDARGFDYIVVTPPGFADPALAIAASRAGALGVLDLQFLDDEEVALAAVNILARQSRNRCGIRLDSSASPVFDRVLSDLPDALSVAILSPIDPKRVVDRVRGLHARNLTVLLEVISDAEARDGEQAGVDGLIAKGNESGGRVGEETTFVLLQRLLGTTALPVWAQGGIGLHSAAACVAAGAAGVVLDSQLALTRESRLPPAVKAAISRLDGSETTCVGSELGACLRVWAPSGSPALDELEQFVELHQNGRLDDDSRREWWRQVGSRIRWDAKHQLWPVGQEAAFAAPLARRFHRVARVLDGFRDATTSHVRAAKALKPLDEGAPLARAHNTRYPIVQGPMTRVSDRAEFARCVAEGGALPFLALALMRAPEVERLLEETRSALGTRPWGVGILGFVPEDLRAEQIAVVRAARPSAALIAGGRPDQALSLERAGIPTYLHVPSPGLLKLFLETGARRFVFEGRECGGHVGPRGSLALWDAAVATLLAEIPASDMPACQVLFAGGIHDPRSALMVATLAAPLAERGAKIGVLLGTAYLFTGEAVTAGAIVEGFQREALQCRQTVLLNSGPGHATRCAITPYVELFQSERRRLRGEDKLVGDVRAALETLNLGRLRIAAKGVRRSGQNDDGIVPPLVPVKDAEQHAEGMYMIGQLAALQHSTRSIAELHHDISHTSSERLDHVGTGRPVSAAERRKPRPFDVAIIGMSCLLPKAPDVPTYWNNILNKVDAVTEVPPDRWDWRKYYDPDPAATDKVNSKWGGFLDPIQFDPSSYGMPPNSLASIEPLQLLTLAAVRAAIADAGYLDRELPRERTAVILGVSGGIADLGQQYAVRSALPMLFDSVPDRLLAELAGWSEDSFPGILPNVAAGRVANRFDLGGVNFTIDAACASSLAAVYLACRELEADTSDVVIVGGADTIQNPFAYLCFGKTHALSPRGRCATFDESADGIAISEGVAILLLKRLADAERDGDRIYAVIKGVAGSSDGRDRGLTAPRPEGQALALDRAYAKAGVSPASVGLVEAHGTGTVVGDQAELETLNRVFDAAGAVAQSCAIGSVKSMIGHTKSTAGVAGLIKVALALHHKVLPPTIHVSTPNPGAHRPGSALYVNSEVRPWVHADSVRARRAGVSAFGFGGTNFHAVLEEYTGEYLNSDRSLRSSAWPSELLVWSGASRAEIQADLAQLAGALARGARPQLCDLAYSAWQAAQKRSGLTVAMAVSSLDDLREKVDWSANALKQSVSPAAFSAKKISFTDTPHGGKTAFLFPGQGSQYPGMLNELATYFEEVRERFECASRVLAGRLPRALASYVFPPPRFRAEDRQADLDALTVTAVAQPALGAAGFALYRLLGAFSVHADMLGGHSYGEYVALCAAGAFNEETLYALSEARGRCMAESSAGEPGSMAGVAADHSRTAAILDGIDGVWIANLNAPSQTVISGKRHAVEAAMKRLEQAGIGSRPLPVACAFHSPLMSGARAQLAQIIQNVALTAPRMPTFSNVSADPYPNDTAGTAELLTEQLVRPVRFAEQIQAMYQAGARVFIEVGPGQVLSGLVDQILGAAPHITIPMDLRDRSGLFQLQHALGQMAAQGMTVNLDPLFAGRAVRLIDLDSLPTADRDPVSPTTWIVTGGRATPQRSPQRPPQGSTIPVSMPPVADLQTTPPRPTAGPQPLRPRPTPTIPAPNPVVAPSPERADDASQAVLRFQQLMTSFLETQKQVMLAYLTGSSAEKDPGLGIAGPPEASHQGETATIGAARVEAAMPEIEPPQVELPQIELPQQATEDGPVDDGDLIQQLVAIVSERTGYPAELLGLDLNLEADLGIDSIKRVEIVGEFGRRVLRSHGVELHDVMAQLSSAKTLRTIADTAQGLIDGIALPLAAVPEKPARDPEAKPTPAQHDDVPRFLLEIEHAPLPKPSHPVGPDDLIVITDDGRGIAERVAASLRAGGAQVALLGRSDGDDSEDGNGEDLTDAHRVSERLDAIRAQFLRPISGILHLLPLRRAAHPTATGAQPDAERAVRTLLHLTRGAASDLQGASKGGRAWVTAATAMGGAFGAQSNGNEWMFGHGAIAGYIKTLAVEWPQVRCKVVDLEVEDPSLVAERLVGEIECGADFTEVGFRGSQRITVRPVRSLLEEADRVESTIDPQDVLLVTGGARGITASIAIDIARRSRPTLVVVGRTPAGPSEEPAHLAGAQSEPGVKAALIADARRTGQPFSAAAIEKRYIALVRQREVRDNLEQMRRLGARVDYRQADVTDDRAFGAVIDDIYQAYGRLDGVIHGAGVIEDRLLEQKTPESFARVFDTKVRSALTLVRHVRPESLRFFALFSSVAGCFGNRGQIDYAAANESLNKLALYLDGRWPGRIVSLNWGPWATLGMASGVVRQELIDRGMTPIEMAAGCLAFNRELRCGRKGQVEVVLGHGRWAQAVVPVSDEVRPIPSNPRQGTEMTTGSVRAS
jgi:acyl transferase domain-containing protein/NAD(P)H-dependent flavin oxidoreductase YrpB (nitropropane dioxygenase family)/NAD(P)-dependent dehydrogenase (short-subunit alcohol dehydrogenase family)